MYREASRLCWLRMNGLQYVLCSASITDTGWAGSCREKRSRGVARGKVGVTRKWGVVCVGWDREQVEEHGDKRRPVVG